MGVGRDRIRSVISSIAQGTPIEHIRKGPKKITAAMRARIVQLTLEDARMSDLSIAETISKEFHFPISQSAINIIRHDIQFSNKPPKTCQKMTCYHIQTGMQFT